MAIEVGIDTLAMYSSQYAMELKTLARERQHADDKYEASLGQVIMAVPPPGEDIITLAANAAQEALSDIDKNDIELLLFATESGIDQSKSAGIYIHHLLNLPARCRVVELKQACYSGTAAIQLALPYLRENPTKKVLMIAADIARYGLNTPGESSQGAGAIAVILSANPRVLVIHNEFGVATESVMDFWRPNYMQEALVDGKSSSKLYMTMLEKCWRQYQLLAQKDFHDHDFYCYHIPVPRLVEKAHQYLAKVNQALDTDIDTLKNHIDASLQYAKTIGNTYTASLYIGLASLLDFSKSNLAGKNIGFYSYGSGCVAEFFSGTIQTDYKNALHTKFHQEILRHRKILSYAEYENFFQFKYTQDGSEQVVPNYETGNFQLLSLKDHKRIYGEKCNRMVKTA